MTQLSSLRSNAEMSYLTAKLGCQNFPMVTTVVLLQRRDGQVLLVKSMEGGYSGEWCLLGSLQRVGESMLQAVIRTAETEVGLGVADARRVAFSHAQDVVEPLCPTEAGPLPRSHGVWLVHVVSLRDGFKPVPHPSVSEYEWFEIEELPRVPSAVTEAVDTAAQNGTLDSGQVVLPVGRCR